MTVMAIDNGIVPIDSLTLRMQKLAYVEVVCVDHYGNPDYHCKTVNIKGNRHNCHWCNGYRLLKATTPQDKQKCNNCGGPIRYSGEGSCWPDLMIVDNFINPADQRPTWIQRQN